MKKVELTSLGLKEVEAKLERNISIFKQIKARILKNDNRFIYCKAIINKKESLQFAIKNEALFTTNTE